MSATAPPPLNHTPSLSRSTLSHGHAAASPTFPLSPAPEFDFCSEIKRLRALRSRLASGCSVSHKLCVISADPRVEQFFDFRFNDSFVGTLGAVDLDEDEQFLIKCLITAEQEHMLFDVGQDIGKVRFSVPCTALHSPLRQVTGKE